MAKTPNTSATSYLPAAEFLKRTDTRKVGQLCSDTNTAIPIGSLPTDANLEAALLDASGELETACLVGKKYDPVDIAALTGSGLSMVYRVLTVLAWNNLIDRRLDLNIEQHPKTPWAEAVLEALRQGDRILSLSEVQDAGHLDYQDQTDADEVQRDGIVVQMDRYFGRRVNRNW